MKVLVLNNNNKENEILMNKLREMYYNVPIFELKKVIYDENHNIRSEEEQNQLIYNIIRTNPDWVFVGYPYSSLDFISSSATSIIFMNYSNEVVKRRFFFLRLLQRVPKVDELEEIPKQYNSEQMREYVKKYARSIIYLKEKSEFQTLLDAIDKHMEL